MTKVTKGDLLDAIRAYSKALPKRPPGQGWRTIVQMAEQEGVTCSAFRQRFYVAIGKGLKVERFVGSDYDQTGALTKQTWFRVRR